MIKEAITVRLDEYVSNNKISFSAEWNDFFLLHFRSFCVLQARLDSSARNIESQKEKGSLFVAIMLAKLCASSRTLPSKVHLS